MSMLILAAAPKYRHPLPTCGGRRLRAFAYARNNVVNGQTKVVYVIFLKARVFPTFL